MKSVYLHLYEKYERFNRATVSVSTNTHLIKEAYHEESGFVLIAIACLVSVLPTIDAQAFQIITSEMMEKEIVTETDLIKTTDNFIILFDTSGSTNQMVPGKSISKIQATCGCRNDASPVSKAIL